jgi:hypothetical protein
MISAAIFSIALPVIAHSQHAAPPATPCANPFPYEPERFLEKLLVVADEVDPSAVAAKFQQVFAVKLRVVAREGEPQFPSYEATWCEWYAPVVIVSLVQSNPSPQVHTLLSIGTRLRTLLFLGTRGEQCLSLGFAKKSLAAAGWRDATVLTDTIHWSYRKGHAQLSLNGSVIRPGDTVACMSEISLHFH